MWYCHRRATRENRHTDRRASSHTGHLYCGGSRGTGIERGEGDMRNSCTRLSVVRVGFAPGQLSSTHCRRFLMLSFVAGVTGLSTLESRRGALTLRNGRRHEMAGVVAEDAPDEVAASAHP